MSDFEAVQRYRFAALVATEADLKATVDTVPNQPVLDIWERVAWAFLRRDRDPGVDKV